MLESQSLPCLALPSQAASVRRSARPRPLDAGSAHAPGDWPNRCAGRGAVAVVAPAARAGAGLRPEPLTSPSSARTGAFPTAPSFRLGVGWPALPRSLSIRPWIGPPRDSRPTSAASSSSPRAGACWESTLIRVLLSWGGSWVPLPAGVFAVGRTANQLRSAHGARSLPVHSAACCGLAAGWTAGEGSGST